MATNISLFDRTASFGSGYVFSMVNRMQMLYFILILPKSLADPYMIGGILIVGIVSHLNLIVLSKWLASSYADKGYKGFIDLFGERMVRIMVFIGLFFILIKITIVTLGYVELVHHLIFPSMNRSLLVLAIMLVSFYLSSQGLEKTIRFGIIAFVATIWMILLYIPFFLVPEATIHHLYPLIPIPLSEISWKGLLWIWSSLAGPEFLICILPWLRQKQKLLKGLMFANALSIVEYLILFAATLVFFGSPYLDEVNFPVLNMLRYLQTMIFERIDIILISMHMFHFVFAIALMMLAFYGGARIVMGRVDKQPSRVGLIFCYIMIFVFVVIINYHFWNAEPEKNPWVNLQIWLGALSYLIIPAFLLVVSKQKRGKA